MGISTSPTSGVSTMLSTTGSTPFMCGEVESLLCAGGSSGRTIGVILARFRGLTED